MAMSNGLNGFHKDGDRLHVNGIGHVNGIATASKTSQRQRLDRKHSAPMMPAFMVSAPGKVIVFGEHAVVHGKVCCATHYDGVLS
jgi:mevalonate kinase